MGEKKYIMKKNTYVGWITKKLSEWKRSGFRYNSISIVMMIYNDCIVPIHSQNEYNYTTILPENM